MLWLLLAIFLLFGLTVFRGAPYVPTHRRQVQAALDALQLQSGDVVVDLGSGDGVFLKAAAQRGLVAYGYEINPILCLIAKWRCRAYKDRVHIMWRDFWLTPLPTNTKGIFVFAGGPFMTKLERKLAAENQSHSFLLASVGFELPHHTPQKSTDGVHLYRF